MYPIVECVPNFSDGRNPEVIRQITAEIESVDDVTLLDVDPGQATNRTVVTFIGTPDAVQEAAFRAVAKAAELIDMSTQTGEHPRQGATDVVPFVPVSGITMEEVTEIAKAFGQRVAEALAIPIYLYENAASNEKRRNLAYVRQGEYEGLREKLNKPGLEPDFGPREWNDRIKHTGATQVSAREFLIAWNVNLNTRSKKKAHSIAIRVREQGRFKIDQNGKRMYDENGNPFPIPGKFKFVKGIGWYIDDYDIAQISMNLTNYKVSPMHLIFDEIMKLAAERGVHVTGSELVGLVPKDALLAAGRYYLEKAKQPLSVNEEDLIHIAIQSLGLNHVAKFDPREKIIEYRVKPDRKPLVDYNIREFANETASDSPAPGGGSIAALAGSMAAALTAMVANLTFPKKEYREYQPLMNEHGAAAQEIKEKLLRLIDEDTNAFNRVMAAFALSKKTPEEIAYRNSQIELMNQGAAEVPLEVLTTVKNLIPHLYVMAQHGNVNSISDVGVAAHAALTCAHGAALNVRINLQGMDDSDFTKRVRLDMDSALQSVIDESLEVLKIVDQKIG